MCGWRTQFQAARPRYRVDLLQRLELYQQEMFSRVAADRTCKGLSLCGVGWHVVLFIFIRHSTDTGTYMCERIGAAATNMLIEVTS